MSQFCKSEICLSSTDILMIVFSTSICIATQSFFEVRGFNAVVMVEPFLIAFFLLRILFSLNYRWTSYLLLLVITGFCICQLVLGYTQLIQNVGVSRGQDTIIGSFSNSGPFGCFLSVCSSLLVAAYFKTTKQFIKISSLVLAVLSVLLLTSTLSRAAMLAFAVSMFFMSMKREKTGALIRKYWVYISLIAVLLGVGAYLIKKPSADGRMFMARIGLRVMKENGLSGVGLGNYAGAYGKAQADFFAEYLDDGSDPFAIDNIPENLRMVADCPSFAFNEYLRIGIEAGPIAMLLFVCLIIAGILSAYRCDNCWCYPLIAISVFACFSYPFEVGVLALLLTVCLAANESINMAKRKSIMFYILCILVFGSIYYTRYSLISNLEFGSRPLRVKAKEFCCNRCKRYLVYGCDSVPDGIYDEKMLFAYGQSLNKSGNYSGSDSFLKIGAEVSSDPMFWNVMGNNSFAQGNYREAESRYKHAFTMVPNRLYPLYLLAKLYYAEGDTLRFRDMAERVEKFKPKVESINTERLRTEIQELYCE